MKKKSEIFDDRPEPVSSGSPLKYKVKVQRRSDILMQEQLSSVANLQDALQQSLDDAQNSDIPEEISFHKDQTERLWMQLEEALMVLKVMYKLNTELQYARLELEKVLKEELGEDVNIARKRVGWLEDRMEIVSGKKRVKTSARARINSRALGDDYSENLIETPFNYSPGKEFDSLAASPVPPISSANRQASSATEVALTPEKTEDRLQQEKSLSFVTRTRSILRQPSGKGSANRGSHVTIKEPEVNREPKLEQEPVLKHTKMMEPQKRIEYGGGNVGDQVSMTTKSLLGMLPTTNKKGNIEEKKEIVDYWESEHHRFARTEEADAICDLYPLSYHQMGLAVPGTFVEDIKGNPNLQFRKDRKKKKLRNDSDGYNEALQQLSERVHMLYKRVKEAAMFSVTGEHKEKISLKSIMGLNQFLKKTKMAQAQPSISRIIKRPQSNVSISSSLPEMKKERIGSSSSGRLVFYPKPLPYPRNLPITRTKMDQVYPRESEVFVSCDSDERPPPKRIVNQHNLYNETKFTSSLFRSKPVREINEEEEKFTPSPAHGESGKKLLTFKAAADVAKAMVTFKGFESNWNNMKPKSNPLDHSGLKWERVKDIVHKGLISPFVDERIDAAKHLGALKCGDATVIYCLKERLKHDNEDRVRYEALKSLLSLGSWEEEILAAAVRFMIDGNQDIRLDLVSAMSNARNVMFIDKKLPSFAEVAKILSLISINENPQDRLSLDAAICLGKMCISDNHGSKKLLSALNESTDYNFKAEALEILVRQVNYPIADLMPFILNQLKDSPVWRYRKAAASLLIHIGKMQMAAEHQHERIYQECELALWNDPIVDVRAEVTKALAALRMYARACETSEKKLEDPVEEIRAQGVISLNSLGVKNERIKRTLVEMLELDSSDYVRILIMKIFSSLNMQDKRIMHVLREKEKGEGPLARSAKKTLQDLGAQPANGIPKVKKV